MTSVSQYEWTDTHLTSPKLFVYCGDFPRPAFPLDSRGSVLQAAPRESVQFDLPVSPVRKESGPVSLSPHVVQLTEAVSRWVAGR